MMKRSDVIVGLDVGTSKICVIVTFEVLCIVEFGRDSVFPEA